jgi:hypothetical protein
MHQLRGTQMKDKPWATMVARMRKEEGVMENSTDTCPTCNGYVTRQRAGALYPHTRWSGGKLVQCEGEQTPPHACSGCPACTTDLAGRLKDLEIQVDAFRVGKVSKGPAPSETQLNNLKDAAAAVLFRNHGVPSTWDTDYLRTLMHQAYVLGRTDSGGKS